MPLPRTLRQLGRAPWGKACVLRRRADFLRVKEEGATQVGRLLILNVAPACDGVTRLGIAVGRRFHPRAVRRNHVRRRIREAFRLLRPGIGAAVWVVAVARQPALGQTAGALQEEMFRLLVRAQVFPPAAGRI